jgi:pimeloyl-ACP methyl ester carboxylesterase
MTHSRPIAIRSPDGVDLDVRMWNSGSPQIVLIHGFGDGSFIWNGFVRLCGKHPAMACIDLRGHGNSGRDPRQQYTLDTHVRDVAHVMTSLDLRDVVLIGHSLGGSVAAAICATQLERVRAVVVVDAGPELRPAAVEYMFRQFREQPWHFDTAQEYRSALAERQPLASETALDDYAAEALRGCQEHGFELKADPALKHQLRSSEPPAIWSRLSELTRPVLVVRGEVSALLTHEAATRFARRLPCGRLATVAMAGHSVMLDNPEGFQAAVSRFLSSNAAISRNTST